MTLHLLRIWTLCAFSQTTCIIKCLSTAEEQNKENLEKSIYTHENYQTIPSRKTLSLRDPQNSGPFAGFPGHSNGTKGGPSVCPGVYYLTCPLRRSLIA